MSKSDWPEGMPQHVIDEIEAQLDQDAADYKNWLRGAIQGSEGETKLPTEVETEVQTDDLSNIDIVEK